MKKKGLGILLADFLLGVLLLTSFLWGKKWMDHDTQSVVSAAVSEQNRKKVALTFDDGPDPVYTPMLLDGLQKRNVKATFFLLGKQIKQYPDLVKRMWKEGHLIGCHSYEHVNFRQISEEAACQQVKKTCDMITEITGEAVSYVRPPYGEWMPCLDEDFCLIPVLWNVDPLDWSVHSAKLVKQRILSDVEENDIILMHDASESSVEAALSVIDTLVKEGYDFVTVEEILFD